MSTSSQTKEIDRLVGVANRLTLERNALRDERDLLREAATRLRREATLVDRTSETTLIQWPSAEVDAFIAAFPISEDEITPQEEVD